MFYAHTRPRQLPQNSNNVAGFDALRGVVCC